MRKINIDMKMYDVYTVKEYLNQQDHLNKEYVAIDCYDGYVIPIATSPTDAGIVINNNNTALLPIQNIDDISLYSSDKVIDYSKASNIKDMMQMQDSIRMIESEILESCDEVYHPIIDEGDTKTMKMFKEAIAAKNFNPKKYEQRIGSNFANEKRAMEHNSISLKKLVRLCRFFDMEVVLKIRDKDGDIPNPMGVEFEAILTDGEDEE